MCCINFTFLPTSLNTFFLSPSVHGRGRKNRYCSTDKQNRICTVLGPQTWTPHSFSLSCIDCHHEHIQNISCMHIYYSLKASAAAFKCAVHFKGKKCTRKVQTKSRLMFKTSWIEGWIRTTMLIMVVCEILDSLTESIQLCFLGEIWLCGSFVVLT